MEITCTIFTSGEHDKTMTMFMFIFEFNLTYIFLPGSKMSSDESTEP